MNGRTGAFGRARRAISWQFRAISACVPKRLGGKGQPSGPRARARQRRRAAIISQRVLTGAGLEEEEEGTYGAAGCSLARPSTRSGCPDSTGCSRRRSTRRSTTRALNVRRQVVSCILHTHDTTLSANIHLISFTRAQVRSPDRSRYELRRSLLMLVSAALTARTGPSNPTRNQVHGRPACTACSSGITRTYRPTTSTCRAICRPLKGVAELASVPARILRAKVEHCAVLQVGGDAVEGLTLLVRETRYHLRKRPEGNEAIEPKL